MTFRTMVRAGPDSAASAGHSHHLEAECQDNVSARMPTDR